MLENQPKNILVIDDDQALTQMLSQYLSVEGFAVATVHDGRAGVEHVRNNPCDLILLDVMLPVQDGFEVLKELRQSYLIPIILLTAKDEEFERVYGLELGADDYIPKPFSTRELLARIRARLRRDSYPYFSARQPVLSAGKLHIDASIRVAQYDQQTLDLTDTEFSLLELLVANKGQVVSKRSISNQVFKRPLADYDRSIDMHVSNLRKKFSALQANDVLRTIRGSGYMIVQRWN